MDRSTRSKIENYKNVSGRLYRMKHETDCNKILTFHRNLFKAFVYEWIKKIDPAVFEEFWVKVEEIVGMEFSA